ncbi:surface-adhesin E family protein [Chitinibacteraceae bacterium HSL-7]
MRLALVLAALLLAACGKFDDGTKGPPPVPVDGDWRSYGEMNDFDVYVEIGHLVQDDNYTYVWMRQNFKAPQRDETEQADYSIRYARIALACEAQRMAETAAELHESDGSLVARYDIPGYQWEFTTPETNTFGSDFMRQVCLIAGRDQQQEKK